MLGAANSRKLGAAQAETFHKPAELIGQLCDALKADWTNALCTSSILKTIGCMGTTLCPGKAE